MAEMAVMRIALIPVKMGGRYKSFILITAVGVRGNTVFTYQLIHIKTKCSDLYQQSSYRLCLIAHLPWPMSIADRDEED